MVRIQEIQADVAALEDPGTSTEDAAGALLRLFPDPPTPDQGKATLVDMAERGPAAVEALLGEPTAAGYAFGCDLALFFDHDAARAHELVTRGLALERHPMLEVRRAHVEAARGRPAQAVEIIGPVLAETPDYEGGQMARAEWLRTIARWQAQSPGSCPCGSGSPYEQCCAVDGSSRLERFGDREPAYRVRKAVGDYAAATFEVRSAMRAGIQNWVDDDALDPEELSAEDRVTELARLAAEHAMWMPAPDDEGPEWTVISRFAEDEVMRPELRRHAEQWARHGIWGLWQVVDTRDPGVILRDFLTGLRLHVEIAPQQPQDLRPWEVLLGYLQPVDGVWHTGAAHVRVSPSEARALAESVLDFILRSSRGRGEELLRVWAEEVRGDLDAGTHLVGEPKAGAESVAKDVRGAMAVALPGMIGAVRRWRAAVPRIANSDGNAIEMIRARLLVDDADAAWMALAGHPDFELEEGGETLAWWGERMSEAAFAQAMAQLREQGVDVPPDQAPGRYRRGTLTRDGSELDLDVNSRARSERLRDLLSDLGHPAVVVREEASDVAAELGQRRRWMPEEAAPPPDSPATREAWRSSFPDDPHPELDGLTPRQAAADERYRDRLETLLRDVEYEMAGIGAGEDAAAVRAALGVGA